MEKADSDSGKSPIDDEKRLGDVANHTEHPLDAIRDPDAGLSDEEKAQIVRATCK